MAATENLGLPLIPVSEYTTTKVGEMVARIMGDSNQSAFNLLDAAVTGKLSIGSVSDTSSTISYYGLKTLISESVSAVYKYKGSCIYAELPSTGLTIGDVYNVTDAHEGVPAGTNYAWNGSAWDPLSGIEDLSGYLTKSEASSTYQTKLPTIVNNKYLHTNASTGELEWADAGSLSSVSWGDIQGTLSNQTDLSNALSGKQDSLVSGTNIKTINNTSILGEGNISTTPSWGDIAGSLANQTDLNLALSGKQESLISGTNIKTINGTSVLGSGDLSLREVPVVETNDKGKFLRANETTGTLEWATASTSSGIDFNPVVPSGVTPTPLTTIEDLNTNTYYNISGGSNLTLSNSSAYFRLPNYPSVLRTITDNTSGITYAIEEISKYRSEETPAKNSDITLSLQCPHGQVANGFYGDSMVYPAVYASSWLGGYYKPTTLGTDQYRWKDLFISGTTSTGQGEDGAIYYHGGNSKHGENKRNKKVKDLLCLGDIRFNSVEGIDGCNLYPGFGPGSWNVPILYQYTAIGSKDYQMPAGIDTLVRFFRRRGTDSNNLEYDKVNRYQIQLRDTTTGDYSTDGDFAELQPYTITRRRRNTASWGTFEYHLLPIDIAGFRGIYNTGDLILNSSSIIGYRTSYTAGDTSTLRTPVNSVTMKQLVDGVVPAVTNDDKGLYLQANKTTGEMQWAEASDVKANVEIPNGATVVELVNLKIGDVYYVLSGGVGQMYFIGNTLIADDPHTNISNNALDVDIAGIINENSLII